MPGSVDSSAGGPCVGLIGQVLPFRGGVAQHTTMLHRELSRRCSLVTISFRCQYPKWLYPGQSDREPGREKDREPGVLYELDPLNPLTWRRASDRLFEQGARMVVIAWWTVFWAPCFSFIADRLERRGVRVVFLCHNCFDHESSFWKSWLARRVLARRRAFIAQSSEDAGTLTRLSPSADVSVYPHPVFGQFPAPRNRLPRRARLELLFFGLVRAYKGLDVLAEAMRLLNGEDVFLTVAGEWWSKDAELRRAIRETKTIELIDRYVPEPEAADLFSRADVVVLPYRTASASGVVSLAYHYGKPVIASRVGGLPDVVADGSSGRLVPPGDARALAEAIREFVNAPPASLAGIEAVKRRMTWEGLASCVLKFASGGDA